MRELFIALLDDDHGVSQEALFLMIAEAQIRNDSGAMSVLNKCKVTDGRAYLPEGWDS